MNNFEYGAPPAPPNPEQQKLTLPATGLIVTGALNAIAAAVILLSGLARLADHTQPPMHFASNAERFGYLSATFGAYGFGVVSLLVAPVLIAGGIAMLQGKRLGLARVAAILAMIPMTSCCCVVGIPVGIWAFRLLKKPQVEDYFRQKAQGWGPTSGYGGGTG